MDTDLHIHIAYIHGRAKECVNSWMTIRTPCALLSVSFDVFAGVPSKDGVNEAPANGASRNDATVGLGPQVGRPDLAPIRPDSAEFSRNGAELGQISTKFGRLRIQRSLAELCPNLVDSGRPPDLLALLEVVVLTA